MMTMAEDFFPEIEIRDDQAEAIARGLYAVARADGNVHEREAAMITEFFNATTDHASHLAALERQPKLDPAHLAAALPSAALRQLFLKSALLLAHVDGNYSAEEKKEIGAYAKACGVDGTALTKLEAAVKDYLLGHLSHLHNVHGVAEVAKELKR
jgi:tellurite resistance protein